MRSPIDLVRTLLLGDPAITAAVGQRIYHMQAPQDAARPHILIIPVSGVMAVNLDLGGQQSSRITVEARSDQVSAGAASANEIGTRVYDCLHGFQGTVGGVEIDCILFAQELFSYEDAVKAARRGLDFYVHLA